MIWFSGLSQHLEKRQRAAAFQNADAPEQRLCLSRSFWTAAALRRLRLLRCASSERKLWAQRTMHQLCAAFGVVGSQVCFLPEELADQLAERFIRWPVA